MFKSRRACFLPMSSTKKQTTLSQFFSSVKKRSYEDCNAKVEPEHKKLNIENNHIGTSAPVQSITSLPKPSTIKLRPLDSSELHKSEIPYLVISELFEKIEHISSRLSIIKICSDFFYQVLTQDPRDLIPVTYLFINKLGPDYEPGLELGLGEGILIRTISEACGKSLNQVKSKYKDIGDLGLVAQEARMIQPIISKPKPLTVGEVFNNLKSIAKSQGKDSQVKKILLIKKMLTACKGIEAKFLIRSLESKLRIGLAEKTVLTSLSKALLRFEHNGKEPNQELIDVAEQKIRDAFYQVPNYDIIVNKALEFGITNLSDHCYLRPGIPLKPMLAKPTKSISEVLNRFQGEKFTCEYKYDGERAQVHLLSDGTMKIYSRNGEDMTERYPELNIKDWLIDSSKTKNLILDCEAVAWDNEQNKILPFQVLSTRKRKGVEIKDIKVRVCLFVFDILYFNEEPLINKTFQERRSYLWNIFNPVPGQFQYANELTTTNLDELQKYLDQAVKDSCEGLMVKVLEGKDSHYEPSRRSQNWLKLKKDYLTGVGDSLDLIVMGAYYGRGKRTGTYGGFLLGCYNQDSGELETCCKIGTGFSDGMLQQLYQILTKTVITKAKGNYIYDSSAEPDVWFEPTMIFEVLTADLSLSPIYKAGHQTYDKGISLRFPRFVKIRDDKSIVDATSSDQVIEFYESQANLTY